MTLERKRIDVAVAVVMRPDGTVLWGCRPEGKPYAGYWEFPGGKVELGETVWQALVRELHEELGITALEGGPWFVIEHDYEHALVRLHLYRVWKFDGQPQSLEGQAFAWDSLQPASLKPILPATEPLLPKLNQPEVLILSQYGMGVDAFEAHLNQALQTQGRLALLFRENDLPDPNLLQAHQHAQMWATKHGVPFSINSSTFLRMLECDALSTFSRVAAQVRLHLTEQHLLQGLPEVVQQDWINTGRAVAVSASVHSPTSLQLAFTTGMDFALLGAVKATASHPGQAGLGWARFQNMTALCRLPVYAIGGLSHFDLLEAKLNGAHGVAMISGIKDYKA
ncbi:MAG: Nudix family hydrolase [Limnobacter sp.]|nr:Nudix family hydrolase [Limnobacter sp.]